MKKFINTSSMKEEDIIWLRRGSGDFQKSPIIDTERVGLRSDIDPIPSASYDFPLEASGQNEP